MEKPVKAELVVRDSRVSVLRVGDMDYISLTDIARQRNPVEPKDVVKSWMRSRAVIEYLGLWERLSNPNIKGVEIDSFASEAGSHHFTMSPQRWIRETGAIGFVSKSGQNGGTFAHPDIAFEFASWISVEFKLYLIKEFERLKTNESYRNKVEWSVRREIAKTNYVIHTDAIKENIVPTLTEQQKKFVYADEADVLNVALFGMTAKDWREQNPKASGNVRDYADVLYLVVLSNLENLNAEMIKSGIAQRERLVRLNETAKHQLGLLRESRSIKRLESGSQKLRVGD
jgi:hypothetical protein